MLKRGKIGTVVLLAALGLMLLGTGYSVYQGTTVGEGTLPGDFYVAMTLGIVFSLVVGVGLMALIFYSHRKGYDEPPTFEE
jgi:formate hydrogenlyase subunit 3/multisubunit Na+/H+ antiporter MnhD subunit